MAGKDFSNSALVQKFIEKATACGQNTENKDVGNNGYSIGQVFHSTGVIDVREVKIDGKDAVYVAVETKEGIWLSIKSLMSLSSLNGYETEGEHECEYMEGNATLTKKVKAEVVDGFDFNEVYQPTNRAVLSFIADAEEKNLFANKTITYLGTVVRPYIAKKDSQPGFEKYKKGMKRVMTAKLWSVR